MIRTLLLSFIARLAVVLVRAVAGTAAQADDPSATLPESLEIPDPTELPLLTGDYSFPVHIGLPITVVIAIVAAIVLAKTVFGCNCARSASIRRRRSRAGIS